MEASKEPVSATNQGIDDLAEKMAKKIRLPESRIE